MTRLCCARCGAFLATVDEKRYHLPASSLCLGCSMPAYRRLTS